MKLTYTKYKEYSITIEAGITDIAPLIAPLIPKGIFGLTLQNDLLR